MGGDQVTVEPVSQKHPLRSLYGGFHPGRLSPPGFTRSRSSSNKKSLPLLFDDDFSFSSPKELEKDG